MSEVAGVFFVGLVLGGVVAAIITAAWVWDKAFIAGRRYERGHPARAFDPLDGLGEVL